jgi:tartrate dehydrogenase/decarboxylase/D-malate dehydrogenase
MRAVERVTAGEDMTPDLGGSGTTASVTDAVCRAIAADNE